MGKLKVSEKLKSLKFKAHHQINISASYTNEKSISLKESSRVMNWNSTNDANFA